MTDPSTTATTAAISAQDGNNRMEAVSGQPAPLNQVEMTYFKHPMISVRYAFKDGKVAHFVNHMYVTRDAAEIKELRKDAAILGLEETTSLIDMQELLDPVYAMRMKYFREFQAEQNRGKAYSMDHTKDAGTYAQPAGLNAASTRHAIDGAAALSASIDAAAAGGVAVFPMNNTPALAAAQARLAAAKPGK